MYYGVLPAMTQTGQMAVVVAKPYRLVAAQMRLFLLQRIALLTVLTAALLAAALAVTHYTVLSPLKRLVETMRHVSQGNLDIRVHIPQGDELGAVGRAFNRMVSALQQAQQKQAEEQRRLALLYDVNRRLASVDHWDELVDLVLHVPKQVLPLQAAVFIGYQQQNHRFTLEGAWGLSSVALAGLEERLTHVKSPTCLHCPACVIHAEARCPLVAPNFLQEDQSLLCLRLAHGETTVGFLFLIVAREERLTEARLHLLNALAGELAVAVAAAQARARELHLLASLKSVDRAPHRLDRTLQTILERTLDVAQAQRGAIFLLEEEGGRLRVRASHHLPQERLDAWLGLALQGLHQSEPVLIEQRYLSGGQTEYLAVVPLRTGSQTLGAMVLAASRPYSRHGVMLLSAIAAQAALLVQTARLYARLEQHAILEERTRLAREIHDGLAQNLAFIRWKLYQMDRWLQQEAYGRLSQELTLLRQVVDETYEEVRDLIEGLRLLPGRTPAFTEVLEEYARRFAVRTGIRVETDIEDLRLPLAAQVQLLRVVQEALTNVRRHARASRVTLELRSTPQGLLRLHICDDGVGFDLQRLQAEGKRHFGLLTMRERVQSLGGRLEIRSRPGEGTCILAWVPLDGKAAPTGLVREEEGHGRDSRAGGG